jgi:hypothetical protein
LIAKSSFRQNDARNANKEGTSPSLHLKDFR